MHTELRIDHRHVVAAHLAGADRVIDDAQPVLDGLRDVLVALLVGTGVQFFLAVRVEGRRRQDLARQLHAGDQALQVIRVAEVVVVDDRRVLPVGTGQADRAAALRPQAAHVHRITRLHHQLQVAARVVEQQRHGVELHVGLGQRRVGLQEAAGLGDRRAQLAEVCAVVLDARHTHLRGALRRDGDAAVVRALDQHRGIEVLLQVLADAGQRMHHVDALRPQLVRVADARQHQQLRRAIRAGREDDFAVGLDRRVFAVVVVGHADRALAFEFDGDDIGLGLHRQVLAALRRTQVGHRRTAAPAIADGELVGAEAFVLLAVEVVAHRHAGLLGGLDEDLADLVVQLAVGHVHRPFAAVVLVGAACVGLGLAEVRQHVVIAPARVAELGPFVVVRAVAARVDHAVDRGRAAERLAARAEHRLALAHGRVGLGFEAPVVLLAEHEEAEGAGRVDELEVVLRPGFEQADADGRIARQAVGKHTAGGARADDDVVVHGVSFELWAVRA